MVYPVRLLHSPQPEEPPHKLRQKNKDASTLPNPNPLSGMQEGGGAGNRPDGGAFFYSPPSPPLPSSSSSSPSSCTHDDETPSCSSYSTSSSSFPLRVNYCAANPCLTREIHRLHRHVLDGMPGADVRLNGMLAVCAMLLPSKTTTSAATNDECCPSSSSCTAHLVLECICGDPRHDVALKKRGYVHQFHHWRRCDFASSPSPRPLRIPISCLITPLGATPQYSLLPDLGRFVHRALLKRYFTDQSKRQWLRTATGHQILGGFVASPLPSPPPLPCPAAPPHHLKQQQQQHLNVPSSFSRPVAEAAASFAAERWKASAMLCTSLLHDSFPCMKKTKRAPMMTMAMPSNEDEEAEEEEEGMGTLSHPHNNKKGQKQQQQQQNHAGGGGGGKPAPVYDPVDVAACVNVLYGTLLKLYPLGAKVPTFNARVVVMARLMHLSSLTTDKKVEFLMQYPALVRLCFMEYSLNALMDWLPCERELFCSICPPMKVYSSVAVAVCDVFRQDHLTTGSEDWAALNRAALSSIDRCIRVCKFKALKTSEISFKLQHVDPATFHCGALDMPLVHILGDDEDERGGGGERVEEERATKTKKQASGTLLLTKRRGRGPAATTTTTTTTLGPPSFSSSPSCCAKRGGDALSSSSKAEEEQQHHRSVLLRGLVDALAASSSSSSSSAAAVPHHGAGRSDDDGEGLLLRSCQTLQRSLRVYPLPVSVAWAQQSTLVGLHSACTARMVAARKLSFCAVCAMNGRGFQCKLRMCCLDGTLSCITCPPGTVVTVDMLGVLLKVGCSSFYMCPCCTGLRVWNGDGSDMHAGQCTCWEFGSLRSALVAESKLRRRSHEKIEDAEVARFALQRHHHAHNSIMAPPQCLVCKSKSVCTRATMLLPDPERRVVRRVHLCARHAPPHHILCNVTGFSELVQAVRYFLANSSTAASSSRRAS